MSSLSNNLINVDFGIKSELEYEVFMYRYLYYYMNPKYSSQTDLHVLIGKTWKYKYIVCTECPSECLFIDLYPKLPFFNIFLC